MAFDSSWHLMLIDAAMVLSKRLMSLTGEYIFHIFPFSSTSSQIANALKSWSTIYSIKTLGCRKTRNTPCPFKSWNGHVCTRERLWDRAQEIHEILFGHQFCSQNHRLVIISAHINSQQSAHVSTILFVMSWHILSRRLNGFWWILVVRWTFNRDQHR